MIVPAEFHEASGFPDLGHLEKAGEGYRLVPAPWNPVI
jgi:hypothetical protein